MSYSPTEEQLKIINYSGKNLIVSASAGSGKTSTLVDFVAGKIEKGFSLKKIMLLTFTKAAASEMKERLTQKLLSKNQSQNILNALDDISTADISTIHSFLERFIKRNLNLTRLDEGFRVLAEDETLSLKNRAFEQSELWIKEHCPQDYEELFLTMHNNRALIFEILEGMMNFFVTQFDAEKKIEFFKNNQKQIFIESVEYIKTKFTKECDEIYQKVQILKDRFDQEKFKEYCQELSTVFSPMGDALHRLKNVSLSTFKAQPTSKSCDKLLLEALKDVYRKSKSIREELLLLSLDDENAYNPEDAGKLEKIFYELYEQYAKNYENLKISFNAVDFDDLEKYSSQILKNDNIKSELQSEFDYVFIDEYQDTNRVQEGIIKEIAKKSNFVAVGDPKQSIYGFRNATSEIIKEDIKKFSQENDSSAEFLRKNFRSDENILNFVNEVFSEVMTEETVGIDYKSTSNLVSGKAFQRDPSLPSVRVDVVDIEKEEDEKVVEVYDILKDTQTKISNKNSQAKVITLRINELLLKKIYDEKTNGLRNIKYKDIVILTRGRNEIVGEIVKELTNAGIPVVNEIKSDLKKNGEILSIINIFKIMLDFQDDVSLMSVMLSKFGNFSVEEIARLRLSSSEKEFYNIVKHSDDAKVKNFLRELENLKFDFEINGAYIMLENLITRKDYRLYLMSKENGQNEIFMLNKFLQILKESRFNFNLPELVSFLSQEELEFKGGGNSENAVSICTIHSSKGLEYPVVILADAGRSILSSYKKNYLLNEKYGLALNRFSRDEDEVYLSPTLYMAKDFERRKNLIDEIMLLYVAMTRAKNHLYIVGQMSQKEQDSIVDEPIEAKTYLEMMFSAYKKMKQGSLDNKGIEVNKITEIEDLKKTDGDFVSLPDKSTIKKIFDYFDFEYPNSVATSMIYKNSVSSLNSEHKIEVVGHSDDVFVEMGNAYHLALKILNFDEINSIQDIKTKLQTVDELKVIEPLVDCELLFENVKLLKKLLKKSKKIYKEQQFTAMINPFALEIGDYNGEIMVQGIVDIFALGEENVLIDYKFTNAEDENIIRERYSKQILLYKRAIEDAYQLKLDKTYILSLKNRKLINF